jgi:hypothetical protein
VPLWPSTHALEQREILGKAAESSGQSAHLVIK